MGKVKCGNITLATTPFVVAKVIHAGVGVKAYPGIIFPMDIPFRSIFLF